MSNFGRARQLRKRQLTRANTAMITRARRRGTKTFGTQVGMELKFVDTESDSDAFAVTWTAMEDGTNDSICGISQGNGESQRIGRKIAIKSIHIRARMKVAEVNEDGATPTKDRRGRIYVVLDTQTNGVQLTATDVMDGGLTDDTLAFRNLQHSRRFRVLWDKAFVVRNLSSTASNGLNTFGSCESVTAMFKFDHHFKKAIMVTYNGTDATISSISDNSLHLIGVANSTSVTLNFQCRVRYFG